MNGFAMNGFAAFAARQDAWCKAMGVRRSSARPTAVLRWLDGYCFPPGFDHTGVYYCPRGRFHFILTEPYHSTQTALLGVQELAVNRLGTYAFAIGKSGSGLWYPGACVPLLIARSLSEDLLEAFAAGLPGAAVDKP